ncbi:hypothetical protein [Grimontia sp. NTOU-MAR1]
MKKHAVGNSSDANLTNLLGLPTLGELSQIGAGFHGAEEYLVSDFI